MAGGGGARNPGGGATQPSRKLSYLQPFHSLCYKLKPRTEDVQLHFLVFFPRFLVFPIKAAVFSNQNGGHLDAKKKKTFGDRSLKILECLT